MASSSSDKTQFRFSDGARVSSEEAEDNVDSQTRIMMGIFSSCDINNTNSVIASKLIDFILPYMMPHNEPELMELKQALDPDNIDPPISKETFFNVMTEWASKMNQSLVQAGDDSFQSPNEKNQIQGNIFCFDQSTPKTNTGYRLIEAFNESELLNASNVSSYSYDGQNKTDTSHLVLLQEKIKELEHQNRTLAGQLEHFKTLLHSEEQNEQYRTGMDNISRKLLIEQKLNQQLQKRIKDTDEMEQSLLAAQKRICKLEKLLTTSEKKVEQQKQNILELDNEKQKFEVNMEQLVKQKIESSNAILELQVEINQKDQEISSFNEIKSRLMDKLDETQQKAKYYMGINERLNTEKKKLEKYVNERQLHDSLPTNAKPLSAPLSKCDSSEQNNSDMYCKTRFMDLSAHESLESEISQVLNYNHPEDKQQELIIKKSDEIQHLQDDIIEYKKEIEKLTLQLNDLNVQIEELCIKSQELDKFKDDYKQVQLETVTLQNENELKSTKIKELTNELEHLNETLATAKSKFDKEMLINVCNLTYERDSYKIELNKVMQSKQDAENAMKDLKIIQKEYDDLKSDWVIQNEFKEQLDQALSSVVLDRDNLKMENANLNNIVNELSKQIFDSNVCKAKIEIADKQLTEQCAINSDLLTNIEGKNQQISMLQDVVKCQNSQMDAQNADASQKIHMYDFERNKLEKQLNDKFNENRLLDNEIITLNKKLEKLQQKVLEIENEKQKYELGYKAKMKNLEELQAKLCHIQTEAPKLTQYIEINNRHVETIADLEKCNQTLCIEKEKLFEELGVIKKQFGALMEKNEAMCHEIQDFKEVKQNHDYEISNKCVADSMQENLVSVQYSDATVQSGNLDCSKCSIFRKQIKELNNKLQEFEDNKNYKKGNFEKLQIMIEKLKVRSEIAEKQLRFEKSKIKTLETNNSELQKELEKNTESFTQKQMRINSEKSALDEELTNALSTLQKLKYENQAILRDKVSLVKRCSDLEKQLEEDSKIHESKFDSVHVENVQLHEGLRVLLTQKTDLEMKVKKTEGSLQKLEAKNLSIRKVLTDLQSNVCEHCKYMVELNPDLKTVEDVLKEKHIQIDSLLKQLNECKTELTEYKIKLSDSSNQLTLLSNHVLVVNENLKEKQQQLRRSILCLYDNWYTTLKETSFNINLVKESEYYEETDRSRRNFEPLGEEMWKFNQQIQLTILLFDVLCTVNVPMRSTENKVDLMTKSPKSYNVFTLKSGERPVSPDSPSLDTEDGGMDELIQDVQNDYFFGNTTIIVASPSISNGLLEDLSLLEEDPGQQWSLEETEQKIARLSTAFMIDIVSIKERHQQQEMFYKEIERKFISEMDTLVTGLKAVKRLIKNQCLNNYLDICIRRANLIICGVFQITSSATQYGAIQQEWILLKCLNLVIDHASHLDQTVKKLHRQSKYISTRCKRQKRSLARSPINIISNESTSSDVSSLSQQDDTTDNTSFLNNFSDNISGNELPINRPLTPQYGLLKTIHKCNSCYWCMGCLFLLLGFVIFLFSFEDFLQGTSWNDFLNRHVTLTYPNGPPPI